MNTEITLSTLTTTRNCGMQSTTKRIWSRVADHVHFVAPFIPVAFVLPEIVVCLHTRKEFINRYMNKQIHTHSRCGFCGLILFVVSALHVHQRLLCACNKWRPNINIRNQKTITMSSRHVLYCTAISRYVHRHIHRHTHTPYCAFRYGVPYCASIFCRAPAQVSAGAPPWK